MGWLILEFGCDLGDFGGLGAIFGVFGAVPRVCRRFWAAGARHARGSEAAGARYARGSEAAGARRAAARLPGCEAASQMLFFGVFLGF